MQGKSDVLVVGAGPAGCAAGIMLARAGVDVCVVDRAQFPRDKTCGDALSNDAVTLLEQLGAFPADASLPSAPVHVGSAVFPDGTCVARAYDRPGYIVPRFCLDDRLRRRLEAEGGKLLQGVRVAQLVRDGERVIGAQGPDFAWSAKLVIAADGHGSVGLPALGVAAPQGRELAISASVYLRGVQFPEGADHADHYFEPELPCGYGWIFPAVDGVANVGVYLRADAYKKTGKKIEVLLDAFVARHADRLGTAERQGSARVWPLPIAPRATRVSGPGLLLAGDAGGFVDPLSGEGIWQALRTGMLAAEIAQVATKQGGLGRLLQDQYERACEQEIKRPSLRKLWVQDALDVIVARRLYRSKLVRSLLELGYRRHMLEMTKS